MTDYNLLEKKQAKRDGTRLIKNSGRGESKGDASTDTLLIDYKFCSGKSFSLNLEKFRKHERDAQKTFKQAAIVVIFTEANRDLAIVSWSYLKELEERECECSECK